MEQTIDLLGLLYELSLTNVKNHSTEDIASNFIKKFLSRKSIKYGAAWMKEADDGENIYLSKIYSMPSVRSLVTVSRAEFDECFQHKNYTIRENSLFQEMDLNGQYAYFKLGEFGLLEFFQTHDGIHFFNSEYFGPFRDVMEQFGTSLENSYSYEKLQNEMWQRNAAERSLKANEEKYRRIIDNIQLGLLEVNNEDIIQHANVPFLELTGYELKELIGKSSEEVLKSTTKKLSSSPNDGDIQKSSSTSYEIKLNHKSGEDKWIIVSEAPNYDKKGQLIGSIGIHLDITEEKKLREENQFKDTQLRILFEKSLDAIVSVNSSGKIIEWNTQAEKIFGYPIKEVLGKRPGDLLVPERYKESFNSGISGFLKSGEEIDLNNRMELVAERKNGEEFPVELTIFPLQFQDQHYFTSFIRDITELKASRENMMNALNRQKELNNMKSQFISMTSHELRTPLTTIKSNTELARYQLENLENLKRDKLLKNISRIEHNVERLDQLINNILMIGQLDSQKVPFNPQMIDVELFIKEKILPDFNSRKQEILFEKSGESFQMNLDRRLFSHILVNLLENAIKYSPNGKSPKIHLDFKADSLTVAVIDKGMGIPKGDQAKLFDTFFRASNVDNIQGTGLGLAIVNEFVKIHGGKINVESEVQKGSTFSILLPKNNLNNNELI